MKKLLPILLCCVVLAFAAPVSADYYGEKDVNADDFTNALVDYCNGNTIHNMTEYEFELSNHDFKAWGVVRTNDALEFRFKCTGWYCMFIPIPIPYPYTFYGIMHVDNPQDGLKKPYVLTITDDDTKFTAVGKNWRLEVGNTVNTRFKV